MERAADPEDSGQARRDSREAAARPGATEYGQAVDYLLYNTNVYGKAILTANRGYQSLVRTAPADSEV